MANIDPATGLLFEVKRPGETRNYTIDFINLLPISTLVNSIISMTAMPAGLTIQNQAFSGTKVSMDLSSGTEGIDYEITLKIDDTAGNIIEDDVMIKVRKAGLVA